MHKKYLFSLSAFLITIFTTLGLAVAASGPEGSQQMLSLTS